MPNYAVVIGINTYRDTAKFGPLSRPVGDALRMMEWLLDPANAHGVAEDDLILLLGPNDDAALGPILDAMDLPPTRLEALRARLARQAALSNRSEAEFDRINKAVRDIHGKAGDQGDRLYFYYSGHGLSAAQDALGNDVEDAIVPSDYDPAVPKLAVSIPSIARTFLATSCREQFFFFDCCRNQLQQEEIARIGRLTPNRRRVPTDQYIYSATALGLTALEGEGLFSDMLLKGLAGEGSAKAFSLQSGTYEVRAERLFQYLRKGFEGLARAAFVGGGEGVPVQPQRPRLGGDHGGDPVLKTLTVAPAVSFRVELETPSDVEPGTKVAEVRVFGEGLPPEPPRDATAETSIVYTLSPRFYFVQVVPEPGLGGPPPAVREIYDDPSDYPVKLAQALIEAMPRRGGVEQGPAPEAPGPERPTVILPSAGALEAMSGPGLAPAAPARLSISAEDPLAPIELVDSAGNPVRDSAGMPLVGLGRLECPDLPPGVYRARMRSPEGEEAETIVAPGPGQDIPIRLRPPRAASSGLARRLTEKLDPGSTLGRLVRVSERVEAMALPAASTLIALASHATNHEGGWRGAGSRLRSLGLPRFLRRESDTPEGIQLFVAGEVLAPAPGRPIDPALARQLSTPEGVAGYLDELEVQIWPMDGQPATPERLAKAGAVASVASLVRPLDPGPYFLSIAGPSHRATTFATVVLDGHTTEIIVHQGADGRIDVSMFLPFGRSETPPDPEEIRMVDMLQRFIRNGDARFGAALAERLLHLPLPGSLLDPVAGMLGGLLLLREGRLDALGDLAARLVDGFPGLPDGHALLGLRRARGGDPAGAREAIIDALGRGLPVLAPLLRATSDAVDTLGITAAEAPRVLLLDQAAERLIPGVLWSAGRPAPVPGPAGPDPAGDAVASL